METTTTATKPVEEQAQTETIQQVEETPKRKVFSLKDVKRFVPVAVNMPRLYEGYDPWEFKLRLKLTEEAEERRQEWLSLSQTEQTLKSDEQALDEICDLLVELPTGFAELKEVVGQKPGDTFRAFVQSITDPTAKELVMMIVVGADSLYWNSISPREFRR